MSKLGGLLTYGAAVGHRGFSAGSNLLITIMAGRQLEAADFGLFALLIAIVALVLILHSSVFSEPMMVYGPRNYAGALRSYLTFLGSTQLVFGGACAFIALLVGAATGGGGAYVALALILPLAFSMDAQERSFFMQLRPLVPFVGAALQFCTLCIILFGLDGLGLDGLAGFLLIHAIGLAVANVFLLIQHGLRWRWFGAARLDRHDVARRHMRFAAWTVVSHLLLFTVTGFYIFMLPLLQDLVTTANFRAQSAVTGPGVQAFSALGMMAVPMLRVAPSRVVLLDRLRKLLLLITLIGLPILLGAGFFGAWLIDLIYDGKYGLLPVGYWLAGLFPMMMGYAFVMGSALRAIDRADLVAWATGVAVLFGLPPGLWLTWAYGAEGVILAQILGAAIMGMSAAVILKRHMQPPFETSQEP
jgi:O-antigen/teichoic acid export membrane protein